MNELVIPEGVSDSGIRVLSLEEVETISGGSNTRGAPRRPMGGGGGWWGPVIWAIDRAVSYAWDRWGGGITDYYSNPNPTWSYEQQYRSF